MRLSVLPLVLAGAGLATQVSAEPIRIIVGVPSDSTTANANIRFGHALANANVNGNDDTVTNIHPPTIHSIDLANNKGGRGRKHGCSGGYWTEQAIKISNSFRHALGLPPIEIKESHRVKVNLESAITHGGKHQGGEGHGMEEPHRGVHILPVPYLGDATSAPEVDMDGSNGEGRGHRHGHHGHHSRPHHSRHGSFINRIHRALMALGKWEGRAVAFVLGCGIGVLIRMFWVMLVLTYRAIRGDRDEEDSEHEYIVFEHDDAENIYIAPPGYSDIKPMYTEVTDDKIAHEEVEVETDARA